MADIPERSLIEIDKQINSYKNELNNNQSHIFIQLAKMGSPPRNYFSNATDPFHTERASIMHTPDNRKNVQTTNYNSQISQRDKEVVSYIKNIKKLQNSLQEKSYILQVNFEKKRLSYQSKINSLQNQLNIISQDLSKKTIDVKQKQEIIKTMRNQTKQLEEQLGEAKNQLADYRKQNVKLKEQNKQYKADNKIIINQIDKLSKNTISPQEKIKILQEKQMRVIKALYMDMIPTQEENKLQIINSRASDLTNKNKLEQEGNKNIELKSLVRRLNQQIDILKTQKKILLQENKIKTFNLENQKQITELSQSSNAKLNQLILKMGDKILNLQQINQTLRQVYKSDEEIQQQQYGCYYQSTKTKVGQFYYKR